MKVKTIKNGVILFLLVAYTVLYKLLIVQKFMKYSEFISVSFLTVVLSLCIILFGFKKDELNIKNRKVLKVILTYIALTFITMYLMGLHSGFYRTTYLSSFISICNNIFIPILLILITEFIRYIFISANKDKKIVVILLTIVLMIFELAMSLQTLDTSNFVLVFTTLTTIVLPCIFKNLVLSYLASNVGYRIPIIYRLIMDMYLFVLPVIPNLGDYISSVLSISLPALVYIGVFPIIEDNDNIVESTRVKKKISVFDVLVAVIIVPIIVLISGIFPHYMLGIGSNSMQPTINKGDAIILEKVSDKTNLKKGDIVAYDNGKLIIVHRIERIEKTGESIKYILKGDANNGIDPRPVNRSQIQGVVKLKVPYIAWPSIWMTKLFHN